MAKQLQLTIPKPCNENWDAMTPEMQGRHCAVCSKTVLDFTLMTDGQILNALQNTKGAACGRFTNDQLNRPLVKPIEPKWYMAGVWKYMLSSFIIFKGVQLKAQVKPGVILCSKLKKDTVPLEIVRPTMGIIAYTPPIKTITGNVKDELGQPLEGAVISIIGTKSAVKADSKGNFTINAKQGQQLEISYVGYERKIASLDEAKNIILIQRQIMGELVITVGKIAPVDADEIVYDKTKINYTVKDANTNTVVPNASVVIERNGKLSTTFADSKGHFTIKRITNEEKVIITVSSIGYQTTSICRKGIDLEKGKIKEEILLEREVKKEEDVVVTGPSITRYIKGDFFQCSKKKVSKGQLKTDSIKKEVTTITTNFQTPSNSITIFPNPIAASQVVQIQYTATVEEMVLLQLVTLEGKILMMQKEKTYKGQNTYSITIPAQLAAQTVVLQLMNSKGKWVATEKLIVQ